MRPRIQYRDADDDLQKRADKAAAAYWCTLMAAGIFSGMLLWRLLAPGLLDFDRITRLTFVVLGSWSLFVYASLRVQQTWVLLSHRQAAEAFFAGYTVGGKHAAVRHDHGRCDH